MTPTSFTPLKDRALILLDGPIEHTSAGGIVVPGWVAQSLYQGRVVAAGPDVLDVKKGDAVIVSKFDKTPINFPGEPGEYLLVSEKTILCVLEEKP